MHGIEHVKRKISILAGIVKYLGRKTILQCSRNVNPPSHWTRYLARPRGVDSVHQDLLEALQRIRSEKRSSVNMPQILFIKKKRALRNARVRSIASLLSTKPDRVRDRMPIS
jgi:hypothetical protein